ncbi:IclR family transcriptional regulator [Bacillus sp. Marseille-Q3570]|uniref:IclR family transcriptional regulator n=1 Tax=Bacillus sp. Marseille-Q3570 TaxID=2963522 RepID=UPI0021B6F4E2|nr:IclR family transcriptional regulator [Bacillus sp. Marseille-Q3570]
MNKRDPALKPLEIIEAISRADKDGLGIASLTENTGLSKSTVHRIAQALTESGYLIRNDSTKKYKLGYRLLRISSIVMNNNDVKEVARPYLHELSTETQETVHLVQLDGLYGIYTDKIDSPQSVGLLSKIGKNIPLHSTGAGKILLAYMSENLRNRVYSEVGLTKQTTQTITDKNMMEKELESIRRLGYGFDRMENREGIHCIAAPVFSEKGKVVASFSVSGPSFRFSLEDAEGLIEEVKEISEKISICLGYVP